MEWTDESIARLRELWQEGLSTAEIGRRMSITKNAVVGKAHRLDLSARPSPIRKTELQAGAAQVGTAQAGTAQPRRAVPEKPRVASAVVEIEAVAAPIEAPAQPAAPIAAVAQPAPVAAPEPIVPQPVADDEEIETVSVAAEPEPLPLPDNVRLLRAEMPNPAVTPARQEPEPVRGTVRAAEPREPRRRGLTCCWPLGEPGTKGFHFCGGDPTPGKPYCAEHAALAYVKLRDRRDSVA